MIITKLQGGLGNQMFQYAFGLAVAKKLGTQLKLDCSRYLVDRKRPFDLDKFNISAGLATDTEIRESTKKTLIEKLLSKPSRTAIVEPLPSRYYEEYLNANAKDDMHFEGFWQSEKYFKAIENQIRQEYSLKGPHSQAFNEMTDRINGSNSVSIHVRRGDYLLAKHQNIYNACSIDYYKEAIGVIKEKIGQIEIFVFSDDPEWVKNNFTPIFPFTLVSNGSFSIPEELALMSLCKYNIIANSTFSWWAAWLNSNNDKIVISPKKWFVDPNNNERDLIPTTWIKI
jgi:hypothetical protein